MFNGGRMNAVPARRHSGSLVRLKNPVYSLKGVRNEIPVVGSVLFEGFSGGRRSSDDESLDVIDTELA
jgi:hypothetical protein